GIGLGPPPHRPSAGPAPSNPIPATAPAAAAPRRRNSPRDVRAATARSTTRSKPPSGCTESQRTIISPPRGDRRDHTERLGRCQVGGGSAWELILMRGILRSRQP